MIFETIREMLCEMLACDEDQISPETCLLEDLGATTEDLEDVMLALKDELPISWTDEDLEDVQTVGDLTRFVEKQI